MKGEAVAPRRRWRSRAIAGFALTLAAFGVALGAEGAAIKAKAGLAQILLEDAWRRTLAGDAQAKPWPWADIWPVAKIEAVRLGRTSIVLSGASGAALAFGPGHLEETPAAGEAGLAVYAAHRDTHFRFLKEIRVGDEIIVTGPDGVARTFIIEQTRIVDAAASGLLVEGDTPKIALVTCWPFDALRRGAKRFVAIGVERSVS